MPDSVMSRIWELESLLRECLRKFESEPVGVGVLIGKIREALKEKTNA